MNFNLNVSKDFLKTISDKASLSKTSSKSVEFDDLLKALDEQNTNSKDSMGIMELIQNLLANIESFKAINNNDTNDNPQKGELLKEIDSIIDKINKQENGLKINEKLDLREILVNFKNENNDDNKDLNFNIDLDIQDIENKVKTNLSQVVNDDKDGINLLQKISEALNVDKQVNTKEVNTKKVSKNTDEKTSKIIKLDDKAHINNVEKLDTDIKTLKSYEELNVSTNTNKNNIVDIKPKEDDKDLNVLENIIDKNTNLLSSSNNKIFTQTPAEHNTLPVVTIRADHMGDDFIKMVKYLKNNNIEEIKVNINPRELGDMTIKLVKDSEATKVFINVAKEDTFNMLNKNIGDINKHLFDLGIKAKDVIVTMKSNNENFFSDNLNQQFNKREEPRKQRKNNQNQSSSIDDIEEIDISQENFNILA